MNQKLENKKQKICWRKFVKATENDRFRGVATHWSHSEDFDDTECPDSHLKIEVDGLKVELEELGISFDTLFEMFDFLRNAGETYIHQITQDTEEFELDVLED